MLRRLRARGRLLRPRPVLEGAAGAGAVADRPRGHRLTARRLVGLALAVALASAVGSSGAGAAGGRGRALRLNDIQVIGTHNSYHVRPDRPLADGEGADYEHAALRTQLERQGVRSLELDAYNGEDFPVFHSIFTDTGSRCPDLERCLGSIERWSRDHRKHVPIILLIEAKRIPDAGIGVEIIVDAEADRLGISDWDATGYARLDLLVKRTFGKRLITPDEVRGKRTTLREAVTEDGWPKIADVRGGVLVVLNVHDELRSLYLKGHPSLRGRSMFVPSDPADDYAAVIKRDVPQPRIFPTLVRDGFLVTTRADADSREARQNDLTRADLAFASGAQVVITDFPVPDPEVGTYLVEVPDGRPARCNPVVAPPRCRPRDLGT